MTVSTDLCLNSLLFDLQMVRDGRLFAASVSTRNVPWNPPYIYCCSSPGQNLHSRIAYGIVSQCVQLRRLYFLATLELPSFERLSLNLLFGILVDSERLQV